MFLVHDDQPEIPCRGKHRAPRADNHPRVSAADAAPFVKALSGAQAGVNHRRHRSEPTPKPGHHLGRQGNLRDQDDRAFSQRQDTPNRGHEHLGFAAAGHPVQQEPSALSFQARQDLLQGFLLPGGQRESGVFRPGKGAARRPERFLVAQGNQPVRGQLFQRFVGILHRRSQFLHRVDFPVGQDPQQRRPFRAPLLFFRRGFRFFRGNGQLGGPFSLHMDPSAAHLRRQHQAERLRQRAVRILRHLLRQDQQFRRDGRVVLQGAQHVFHAVFIQVAGLAQAQDDALFLAPPEGHRHPLSGHQVHSVRNPVGKRACHVLVHDVDDHLTEHPFPSFMGKIYHLLLYLFLARRTSKNRTFPCGLKTG